ncbi:hypothetical protein [Aeromonas veronii]|uniref:hypothetical protein n=1 Tax=Aeromonas veronii TaxID=654 RepID=UPI0035B9823B
MEMLTEREERYWKALVWVISTICPPLIISIYNFIFWIKGSSLFPTIISANITTIIGIVTSFSITMTGFIAAIGAYLLSISRSPAFSEWKNNGYLSVFFNLYGAAIIFLLATFGACLMMLLTQTTIYWLKIVLSLVIVNLFHIISITYIVINQAKNDNA